MPYTPDEIALLVQWHAAQRQRLADEHKRRSRAVRAVRAQQRALREAA